MKAENMTSANGIKVVNQFIISDSLLDLTHTKLAEFGLLEGSMFQSYNSNIAFKTIHGRVYLDETYWNYSRTTSKYRNQFLGETTKETQAKIDSGEYILTNLN